MPQAVGEPIAIGETDDDIRVFDLHRDGNMQAFVKLHVKMRLAGSPNSRFVLYHGHWEWLQSIAQKLASEHIDPATLPSMTLLPDCDAAMLASYNRAANRWDPIFSSVYSGEGETVFGEGDYSLVDVLDIDGDGKAEVVLSRGSGEVGDLEIYRYDGNRLILLTKIPGWTGS